MQKPGMNLLFFQKIIFWLTLSFSCNRVRLSHVNSAWIILCKFRDFNCAIFPNSNLVEEIILPQSLDRFEAVLYGKFVMMNRVDFVIERIRSTGMVKRECIRFILIPSQINFCGCHWIKLFLTNSASSSAEGGGGRDFETVVKICANFYSFLSPKLL